MTQVADSSIMGTMSQYATSAWNTITTTTSKVAGTVYEYGKFGLDKCYEGLQKVVAFVKPLFTQLKNFVCNNPGPVAACLAVGAGLYLAATQCSGRVFGTATTAATTTA